MNIGGMLLEFWRRKRGEPLKVIGELAGMSGATLLRIERGEKIPSEREVACIADALTIEPQPVQDAFDQDRMADILSKGASARNRCPPLDAEILASQAQLVALFEAQRMTGISDLAVLHADAFIERWERHVDLDSLMGQVELKRLLMQASLTRAYALTVVVSGVPLVRRLQADPILTRCAGYLAADDHKYRDMCHMLPGLLAYLSGNYQEATSKLDIARKHAETMYISSLAQRNIIVSTAKLNAPDRYRSAAAQARELIDSAEYALIDKARLLEGQAYAGLFLRNDARASHLVSALTTHHEAMRLGQSRTSVALQLARTEIQVSLSGVYNADDVAEIVTNHLATFRKSKSGRYVSQVKALLQQTAAPQLQSLAATI